MFNKFTHFIKYNNVLPIFFGILFLGAGGALASNEEVRDSIMSSEEITHSIDNTRIVNLDLNNYLVTIEIVKVEEDSTYYYVTYTLNTVDIVDGVWIDVGKENILTVLKESIEGKDLGTHTSEELVQVRDSELSRLKETQVIERNIGLSTKVVATVYSGLVGRFLDTTEEEFSGYTPVVKKPTPAPVTEPKDNNVVAGDPSDTEPPVITILGNNPARITFNSEYSDLGAFVADNKSDNLGYKTFVDGVEMTTVQIDTGTTTTYIITYRAVDQVGNVTEADRLVEVYNPNTVVEILVATSTPTTTPEIIATTTPPVIEEPATTTPPIIEEPATTTPHVEEENVILEE